VKAAAGQALAVLFSSVSASGSRLAIVNPAMS
jgi:hypothetical protein